MNELELLHSEGLSNILAAYATAAAVIENVAQNREVEVPIKDKSTGGYKGKYKFSYATLAGILHHVRQPLTQNGIWFTQYVKLGFMVTRLVHSSGEWMETGAIPMPDFRGGPQDIGSIISYFKRYSLSAALGLASEEDNDGEQGEREVSFRSRGGPAPEDNRPQYEEPEGGWGDWARTLIGEIEKAPDEKTLNEIAAREDAFLRQVYGYDRAMHSAITKAVKDRRAVVNDKLPF